MKKKNWISVKDKLPKDDEAVLMLEEGQGEVPLTGYYQCEDYIPGFYPSGFFTIRMHVTHWMPLPKRD